MKSKTILLVEDNADDELLTLRALRRGHIDSDVVVVRDGAQALDYCFGTVQYDLPDLILLDLKLPKVDGLTVLRRLRSDARTRLLPVVILTSSDEERDIVSSYDLGANSYIRKPVDFQQFQAAVRHLGLYWLTLNQLPPAGR